ncbi:MAG: replication-associated recombination protein A [Candidatus Eremiobacteraeota bacterium]|nr:replication-associated recombination protein A [Candidatus Eremiobacteraeota bacterium]
MRPLSLDEFVGQEHLIGADTALRAAIERRAVPSMILWGPPGSGKTTLARLIARATGTRFVTLSAVAAGVSDLRRAVAEARVAAQANATPTIVFIDAIHRSNKAQQDAILPAVERGDITLIGATTENPSFEVNKALLSRSRVFVLASLSDAAIDAIIERALHDPQRGLGGRVIVSAQGRAKLVALAGGDARSALNALELAAQIAAARGENAVVEPHDVEQAMQRRALRYDRAGDEHYDVISAFIKSIRDSDADAGVYWLARMLEAGEDPMFIARRLVILSSEDVGLADPQALPIAVAAQAATHALGMPEALYPLTEATIYLALAPKSNSGLRAYAAAKQLVDESGALPVPLHLRNAPTDLMRRLGYGKGYRYAHDFDDAKVEQQHLPDGIGQRRLYEPGTAGWETTRKR